MKKTRITDQALIQRVWFEFQELYEHTHNGRYRRLSYLRGSARDSVADEFRGFLLENGIYLSRDNRSHVFEVLNEETAMLFLLKYG